MKAILLKTSFNTVVIGIIVLVYRILLDFTYILYLEPQFSYAGFGLDISTIKVILSYMALLLLYLLTPKETLKPSSMVIQFFYLMVYVPFTSFYALSNSDTNWFVLFTLFWVLVFFLNQLSFQFTSIRSLNFSVPVMAKALIVMVLSVFVSLIIFTDFKLNFNLMKVYELRAESDLDNMPLSGYLVNWTAKIFVPFLMLYYLYSATRSINIGFVVFTIALILLFATTGHKDYLFRIPMMIGTVILLKSEQFYKNFVLTLAVITLTGLSLYVFLDNEYTSSFLVRRTLFLPAKISYHYYDFFTNNHVFLSNSLLKSYIDYPFDVETPRLIGAYYMGSVDTSANNGVVSDGYMHFGVAGIFLWGIFLVFLLKFTDAISRGKVMLITWPLILLGYKTIIDGAFFTTLLTHGLLITLLVVYLMKSENETKKYEP
jgi:hypothetical protein